jgi:hypothetical protein
MKRFRWQLTVMFVVVAIAASLSFFDAHAVADDLERQIASRLSPADGVIL